MTSSDPITNAQRWSDELAPGHDVLVRVEKLLFSHAPTVSGDCVCGWALHTRRGISHATHLVQKLAAAGLLAVAAERAEPERVRVSWRRGGSFFAGRSFADGAG